MKVFAEGAWNRPPKIILGIDIGTTRSAVSFAYLYPDGPQSLHMVTAWPGQEANKGEPKIPTLVYYNTDKKAVSFGAEALKLEIAETAEDEQWQLTRHFKLHLHPDAMKHRHHLCPQPLPVGVTLLTIYTDFLAYLLKHIKYFFESRIINGQKVWKDHHQDMTIVFTHPNGWGLKEKGFLRLAAIAASYVPSSKATSQIRFVSETEASVHSCLFHNDLYRRLKPNTVLVVCDAGESRINTTVYSIKTVSPTLELEERKASVCVQAGSVFVSGEFEEHLARILDKIEGLDREDREEYLRKGVKHFEATSQKEFEDVTRQYRVELGMGRLRHKDLGIMRGAITLEGSTMKGFFDKSVTQTIESHILLVGGFGDCLFLRKSLIEEFGKDGCAVHIADDLTYNADGAVIWCGRHSDIDHVTRMAYGIEINAPYNPREPSHVGRPVRRHDAGYNFVTGKWSQIVERGVTMNADSVMRLPYWRSYKTPNPHLANFKVTIFAYTADGTPNPWLRDSRGNMNPGFEQLCEIEADLSEMRQALKRKTGRDGDYYFLDFTMALQFGDTELRAFVEWKRDGETRTGPAAILPSALSGVQD
ncbi:heat shock 70 kDa protein 12A [Rhizoctonia solani AG-3 Rhs1AP]|uniref:Heat shock 70 kDa protein 12A n=1 Tax=Rhizoctonia solani AG-3 Rhs1AP TaxID=1086054 RepID=X8J5S5_9AGAM|nr:heat shock 70 kDa protein 12A [Rhizoctonia solani AG-3 Rhs1AP]